MTTRSNNFEGNFVEQTFEAKHPDNPPIQNMGGEVWYQ